MQPTEGKISLRELIEQKIDALEKLVFQKMASQDKAVELAVSGAAAAMTKAEAAISERLALLNESRQTISDITSTMIPRSEYAEVNRSLAARIEAMEKTIARSSGIAIGISGIAVLITIAEFIRSVIK